VEKSIFPVILTVNDPYEPKIKELKKSSQLIEFHKLQYRTIAHALQWVCEQENIKFEEKAINSLSRQADGDLRGALIDLQSCSSSGKLTAGSLSGISDRKRTDSILHALTIIFKSSSVDNALPALDNLDLEPREIFLWLDTNLPQEYTSPSSLAKAYEHLSRADIFQGRITRRQHWRFLVYINNLLTAGISSAKDNKNITFFGYKPTMRLLRIWQSNIKNAKKKQVAEKLARATHTSVKVAAAQLPYLKQMFKSKSFSSSLVRELNLADDEVEWLRK
jgi:replication factor C large subunit